MKKDLHNLSKEDLIEQVKVLQMENKELKSKMNMIKTKPIVKLKHVRKVENIFKNCKWQQVALKIAYIGINYSGFAQQQQTQQTIEEYLFNALQRTLLIQDLEQAQNQLFRNYSKSGRTDKGVSALGNVISIRVRDIQDTEKENYLRMLNRNLPSDIRVLAMSRTQDTFNARYQFYKYFFVKEQHNIEKMREAAKFFIGKHDFRNFSKIDLTNSIDFDRTMFKVSVDKVDDQFLNKYDSRLELYVITVGGSSFLYHQIRCMMQVLFNVGMGHEDPSIIPALLDVKSNPKKPKFFLYLVINMLLIFLYYYMIVFMMVSISIVLKQSQLKSMIIFKRLFSKELQRPNYILPCGDLCPIKCMNIQNMKQMKNLKKMNNINKVVNYKKKKFKIIQKILQKRTHKSVEELKESLTGKRLEMYQQKVQKRQEYDERQKQIKQK